MNLRLRLHRSGKALWLAQGIESEFHRKSVLPIVRNQFHLAPVKTTTAHFCRAAALYRIPSSKIPARGNGGKIPYLPQKNIVTFLVEATGKVRMIVADHNSLFQASRGYRQAYFQESPRARLVQTAISPQGHIFF